MYQRTSRSYKVAHGVSSGKYVEMTLWAILTDTYITGTHDNR